MDSKLSWARPPASRPHHQTRSPLRIRPATPMLLRKSLRSTLVSSIPPEPSENPTNILHRTSQLPKEGYRLGTEKGQDRRYSCCLIDRHVSQPVKSFAFRGRCVFADVCNRTARPNRAGLEISVSR